MTFKAKKSASEMNTRDFQDALVNYWSAKCVELLQDRGSVPRDELEYIVEQVDRLKNERLKSGIAGLIGWGDDERAELETFCAIALEVMKQSSPSKLREAALKVELRFLLREQELAKVDGHGASR